MRRSFDAMKELAAFEVVDENDGLAQVFLIDDGEAVESYFRGPQDAMDAVDFEGHHRPVIGSFGKEMSISLHVADQDFFLENAADVEAFGFGVIVDVFRKQAAIAEAKCFGRCRKAR